MGKEKSSHINFLLLLDMRSNSLPKGYSQFGHFGVVVKFFITSVQMGLTPKTYANDYKNCYSTLIRCLHVVLFTMLFCCRLGQVYL